MAEFSQTIEGIVNEGLTAIRAKTGSTAKLFPTAVTLLNHALQELSFMHTWRWLRKTSFTAATVAETKNVALPATTLQIVSISYAIDGGFRIVDHWEEDRAYREYPEGIASGGPVAFIYGELAQATPEDAGVPSIDLFPTPDAIYTLNIRANKTIPFFDNSAGDRDNVPPIPTYLFPLLRQMFRVQLLQEYQSSGSDLGEALTLADRMKREAIIFDKGRGKAALAFRQPVALSNYRRDRRGF